MARKKSTKKSRKKKNRIEWRKHPAGKGNTKPKGKYIKVETSRAYRIRTYFRRARRTKKEIEGNGSGVSVKRKDQDVVKGINTMYDTQKAAKSSAGKSRSARSSGMRGHLSG